MKKEGIEASEIGMEKKKKPSKYNVFWQIDV